MELEKRLGLIEKAILTMKDLVVSHNERIEDYYRVMRESREDFDFKMNALVDAQIKNEAEIEKLWSVSKTHEARIQRLEK